MPEKILIINADDYGFSQAVNNAIISCFLAGRVTSISIMPTGEAFKGAVDLLKRNKIDSVGVHVALTGKVEPCALKGVLPSDYKGLFLESIFGSIKKDDLYSEISAQVKKVLAEGLEITHIDGHEHVHMIKGVFEVMVAVAKENRIPYMRLPLENALMAFKGFSFRDLVRYSALRIMSEGKKRDIVLSGLKCNDAFFGHFHSGRMTDEIFCYMLEKMADGINEMAVHPAVPDGEFLQKFPWYRNASNEYDILLNGKWFDKARQLGIHLVSHKEL